MWKCKARATNVFLKNRGLRDSRAAGPQGKTHIDVSKRDTPSRAGTETSLTAAKATRGLVSEPSIALRLCLAMAGRPRSSGSHHRGSSR
jgi:hypothetical protein